MLHDEEMVCFLKRRPLPDPAERVIEPQHLARNTFEHIHAVVADHTFELVRPGRCAALALRWRRAMGDAGRRVAGGRRQRPDDHDCLANPTSEAGYRCSKLLLIGKIKELVHTRRMLDSTKADL
jgi:hypothetical protein